MSILKTKVLPALKGTVKATVKDYTEVVNPQGGYVQVTLQLPDREYLYNIFPGKDKTEGRQISYFVSAISRQLKIEEGFEFGDFLELLKSKQHKFDVHFTYDEVFNRTNVGFHTPTAVAEVSLDEIVGA